MCKFFILKIRTKYKRLGIGHTNGALHTYNAIFYIIIITQDVEKFYFRIRLLHIAFIRRY